MSGHCVIGALVVLARHGSIVMVRVMRVHASARMVSVESMDASNRMRFGFAGVRLGNVLLCFLGAVWGLRLRLVAGRVNWPCSWPWVNVRAGCFLWPELRVSVLVMVKRQGSPLFPQPTPRLRYAGQCVPRIPRALHHRPVRPATRSDGAFPLGLDPRH